MKKTLWHCNKIFFEIFLGLFLLIIIALGFFAWKLSQGPINIDRAIPYIESQLHQLGTTERIEIESMVLEWRGFSNPLGFSAINVSVSNDRGPFLFAPEIDIDVSWRRLMIGQLRLQSVWIRNIALSITKTETGQIQLTGHSATPKQPKLNDEIISANLTLRDLIYDLPKVDVLWIDKARIIYNDQIKQTIQRFDPVTFYIQMNDRGDNRDLLGFLTFPFGQETNKNTVKLNFSTQNNPVLLSLNGNISETPIDNIIQFMPKLPKGFDFNMVADTEIQAQLNNTWGLHQLNLKISAPRGQIQFPLNDKDDFVDVSDLVIHATQDPKIDTTVINNIQMRVNDAVDLQASGTLTNLKDLDKLSGNIDLSIKNLPQNYFNRYWPQDYSDNGAYEWLTQKMEGGTYNLINLTTIFDLAATARTDGKPLPNELIAIKGDMIYEGLNVDYKSPLPVATNISGTGTYDDIELTLNVTEANVGGMITKGGTLHFDDLITKGAGLGTLTFPVISNTQNVFDYIATDPINAFDKIDFKGKNTKGDVDATIKIEIPLTKGTPIEDIKVSVEGIINNAEIPNAVKGLTLSGGPYDVFATTQEIKVKGSGLLSGKPITLDWHEYFSTESAQDYISKVTATVTANDKIRRAFTNDFADYFEGDTSGDVVYIKDKNNRDAMINLNLDLTNTLAIVPSLGLDKPSGQKANATTNITLKNGDLTAVKNLKISGAGLSLASGNIEFKTVNGEPLITKAALKNMAFNENRISILMAEHDGMLKTNVTGSFLDARPILSRKKEEGDGRQAEGRPREYGVDVLEMRTADDTTIKNPKAYIRLDQTGKADKLELDAKLGANGQAGDLYVRYTPDVPDGLTLRVESNNAGETLRAFDLYPYINGGQLQIAGVPLQGGRFGDVRGKARINDFQASNAPVLLRLVNALSFQSFLQAGALNFTRLESDFEWKLGDMGDIYTISNGTTSGTSVALTFDGFVNTADKNINITGTAAPLSEINNFVGKIPILGNILTGGGALLAATYSIKGDPSDPSVTVNPLSILTPGIIRKMLFENTPQSATENNATPQPNQTFQNNERTSGMKSETK